MRKLFPHQEVGARWLAERNRALLGDDPGLGKSATALAAAAYRGARRVLVIGPAIARAAWGREYALMATAGVLTFALRFESYQKFVLSPATRDEVALFAPDVVILDEFHYLKHSDSQRTRMILGRVRPIPGPIAVWGLSGTPVPRNALELYPIVRAFWPREMSLELGVTSMSAWRDRFTVWRTVGSYPHYRIKVVGSRNVEELRDFMRGKMLRRRDRDALPDLQPIRWTEFPMSLTPSDADAARAVEDSMTPEEREDFILCPTDGNTSRVRHELGDLKAPLAAQVIRDEMLREDEGSKRIVFAYHRSVLNVLQEALQEFGLVRVDGSTNAAQRASAERLFQEDPAIRVFLGQNEAAGVSVTLTASHRVDIIEPGWVASDSIQAGKRAHRIGQDRPVWVRFFAMADTLDEAIVRQHNREIGMVADILHENDTMPQVRTP